MVRPTPQDRLVSAGKGTFRFVSVDADVFHTLVFRIWSIAAGAATVIVVPTFLTGIEQGYYYTFASLLALQIFFELGMGQVVLQLVSHSVARARHSTGRELAGLISLLRRWYSIAAVAFFALVSSGGAWFLSREGSLSWSHWLGPWLCLVLATAVNLYLSAMLAIIEGTGSVARVAKLRFRQSALGYALTWAALAAGAALWATCLLPVACAAYTSCWLPSATGPDFQASHADSGSLSWRREVFPLQWRIALSWIGGYFAFQLLTPMVFAKHSAVEAGRLGITLAVFNAVLSTGMSWVNAKFPEMSMHLARHERGKANHLFRRVATRAVAFTTASSVLVLIALGSLFELKPEISERFTSLPAASCLAVATVANTVIFAAAAYLRAHKEEPMLWVSLAWGTAILIAVDIGARWGTLQMMALYAAVTVFLPLPWTLILFRRYFTRP